MARDERAKRYRDSAKLPRPCRNNDEDEGGLRRARPNASAESIASQLSVRTTCLTAAAICLTEQQYTIALQG